MSYQEVGRGIAGGIGRSGSQVVSGGGEGDHRWYREEEWVAGGEGDRRW